APPLPAVGNAARPLDLPKGEDDVMTTPLGEKSAHHAAAPAASWHLLARCLTRRAQLARAVVEPAAPLVQLDDGAATGSAPTPAGGARAWAARLPPPAPITTNYRYSGFRTIAVSAD